MRIWRLLEKAADQMVIVRELPFYAQNKFTEQMIIEMVDGIRYKPNRQHEVKQKKKEQHHHKSSKP